MRILQYSTASLAIALLVGCTTTVKEPVIKEIEGLSELSQPPTKELLQRPDVKLAQEYLTALQAGNLEQAKSLYCVPEKFANSRFQNLQTYDIAYIRPEQSPQLAPELSFTSLQVGFQSSQAEEQTGFVEVWRTDDHYQAAQAENQAWQKLQATPNFATDRSSWTQQANCIYDVDRHFYRRQIETGMSLGEIQATLRSPGEIATDGGNKTGKWVIPEKNASYTIIVSFENDRASSIQLVERAL